jgi:hypothetical protein
MVKPTSWGNQNLNPQAKDSSAKTLEEMIPRRFHQWMKVFEKKASDQMPK